MKKFALIGASGYIAPRHFKAIKETGNILSCALDPYDCVGVIDSYFPNADFFTEFERFDRHVDKLRRKGSGIDFLSICSPNYLHDSHIRFGLRSGASVVCEKPLVLNPWNIEGLEVIERESGKRVYNILQLRLHPNIVKLRKKVQESLQENPSRVFDVDLTYITSRGKWYFVSWKGDTAKSGGVATNIGVHFFDMLVWIFGEVRESIVHYLDIQSASGVLVLKHAQVRWFLSVDARALPKTTLENNQRTFRLISLDGESLEFSDGFTDLHTESYREILNGNGFGLQDVKASIDVVYSIRNAKIVGLKGDYHPLLKRTKEI